MPLQNSRLFVSFLDKGMAAFLQGANRQEFFFRENASLLVELAGFLESWLCFTMGSKGYS
jgi:hypothetical protein